MPTVWMMYTATWKKNTKKKKKKLKELSDLQEENTQVHVIRFCLEVRSQWIAEVTQAYNSVCFELTMVRLNPWYGSVGACKRKNWTRVRTGPRPPQGWNSSVVRLVSLAVRIQSNPIEELNQNLLDYGMPPWAFVNMN